MIQPHKDMKKIKKKYSLEIKKKDFTGCPKKEDKVFNFKFWIGSNFF